MKNTMNKRKLEQDSTELKTTRFKSWKSGKQWLYASSALALLVGSGTIVALANGQSTPQASGSTNSIELRAKTLADVTQKSTAATSQNTYVKTASNSQTLAAVKKVAGKDGVIKGGALTVQVTEQTPEAIQKAYEATQKRKAQLFDSKSGQELAKQLDAAKNPLALDTLQYWAYQSNQIAALQKGDAFSKYVDGLKKAANWDKWTPEMQALFESGNAPINGDIKVTPPSGKDQASASSAVESLQQIYSGAMVKYIPVSERAKIFTSDGVDKYKDVAYVDASKDAGIFLNARKYQDGTHTRQLLTELMKAKTLAPELRSSFEQTLSTAKLGSIQAFTDGIANFVSGGVAKASSIGDMTSGNGWTEMPDGGFTATDNQPGNYFMNDANGGGFIQAPDGKWYPSFCIDVSDGGANQGSSFNLNPVNDANGNLTSGGNAGNIASLLPSDNDTRNSFLNLLFAATQVAGMPVNGTDKATAQNLIANMGVLSQSINAFHSSGSIKDKTKAQILDQASWNGTWVGDHWSEIMAQMAADEKASAGTPGISYPPYVGQTVGTKSVDTGLKAPSADQILSGSLTETSKDGNAQLYVGSNGNIWIKVLKPANGTAVFDDLITKGTLGTVSAMPPFYFADSANNNPAGGLQTRLSPVGYIPTADPLRGKISISLKMLALGENEGTKVQASGTSPTGVSQAGAVLELQNITTGKRVTKDDSIAGADPITATAGTLGTGSDGNLQITVGSDGKYGVKNLPVASSDGDFYTYGWVEVQAPNGEAIEKPSVEGQFTFSADDAIDSTNNNLKTDDTKVSDVPALEVNLDKDSTNDAVFGNNLDKAVYKVQNKNASGNWVDVLKTDGLNMDTGESANVVVATGTDQTGDDGVVKVQLTKDGKMTLKNLDSSKLSADFRFVEVDPATGHAMNTIYATATVSNNSYSDDKSNLTASAKTTDMPLGETAIDKVDADTKTSQVQGNATLKGAEATLYARTSTNGTTTLMGKNYAGTWVPVKQTQGGDPTTGQAANVVLADGAEYAKDANGNVVLVSDDKGNWGRVTNIDLTNYTTYGWLETTAPYGYTRNTTMQVVSFSPGNDVSKDNVFMDSNKNQNVISDRVIDFAIEAIKSTSDDASTSGLNGAEFTLTPIAPTLNSLGKFDNGPDTNINGQDFYLSPTTGLPTPVTSYKQLYLGATQTTHSYKTVTGLIQNGRLRFDHIQAGSYWLDETKVPDGYEKTNRLRLDILPGDQSPAPSTYEFKVTDTVTGKVLNDVTLKVTYDADGNATAETDDPTQGVIQLTDDLNFLGAFSITGNGFINDKPITPPTITTTATDLADGDKTLGVGIAQIRDTAVVENLKPNVTYTMIGNALHKEDGSPVTDNGQAVTSQVQFTTNALGNATVNLDTPAFSTANDAGKGYTMTETVKDSDGNVVVKEDNWKDNPDQSVDVAKPTGETKVDNPNVALTAETVEVKDHYHGTGYTPNTKVDVKISEAYSNALKKTIPVSGEATFTADGKGVVDGDLMVKVNLKDYFAQLGGNPETYLVFYEKAYVDGLLTVDNHNPDNPNETIKPKVPKPSIDDEKTDGTTGQAGNGNNTDKDNNVAGDRDTPDTALVVKPGQTTKVYAFDTNNGTEPLKDIVWKDMTLSGPQVINWTHEYQSADGKTKYPVTVDAKTGFLEDKTGKDIVLNPGDHIASEGELPALDGGVIHEDQTSITGTGVITGKTVNDKDKWNAKPATPTIKTKAATADGNQVINLNEKGKDTPIYDTVELTNVTKGEVTHAELHRIDDANHTDTVVGSVDFTVDDAAVVAKQKKIMSKVDTSKDTKDVRYVWTETLKDKTGKKVLATHNDLKNEAQTVTVEADKPVPATPAPSNPVTNIFLPHTGESNQSYLTRIGLLLMGVAALAGVAWKKRQELKMGVRRALRKLGK